MDMKQQLGKSAPLPGPGQASPLFHLFRHRPSVGFSLLHVTRQMIELLGRPTAPVTDAVRQEESQQRI